MPRTGRPKTSTDIEVTCKLCSKQYTIPSWQKYGLSYCSLQCRNEAKRGKPVEALRKPPTIKVCPQCGTEFETGGWGRPPKTQVHCSDECHREAAGYKVEVREMLDTEISWLAGLFDGEGSIVFVKRSKDPKSLNVRIVITNTVRPLLEKVHDVTGVGSIVNQSRYKKNPKHNDCWNWQVNSTAARKILQEMLPWLIVKRGRAMEALGLPDDGLSVEVPSRR